MLASHVRLALRVLLRRKAFTAVSLFGITFTLVVLTTAAAFLESVFGARAPEVNHDRTLGVFYAQMTGPRQSSTGPPGFALLDRYARGIPGVERMSIFSVADSELATRDSYVAGRRVTSYLKRTDADFWRILRFDFVEGGPFTEADVDAHRFVAVINETTRASLLGGGAAVGRTIELGADRFTVVGVVRNVPMLRVVPFSDVWVPLTTARSDAYRTELRGDFMALLLAEDEGRLPGIQREFAARMRQVDLRDTPEYDTLRARADTLFSGMARMALGEPDSEDLAGQTLAVLLGLAVLFMVLPAVNLVNLSVSRMMERAPESGVRKAFGATTRALVAQFVLENVVLTVIGGLLALALSGVLLSVVNRSGLLPYGGLELNARVFLWGLGFALLFGVLSGAYPAWRMSRLHPVAALRGAGR